MHIPGNGFLDGFHPLVQRWFFSRFSSPTAAQAAAWPKIASGEHVLVAAPTGSGKTLTAFLFALDRLASGVWKNDGVQVLYVSPLKALNNDIRRNLTEPLDGIHAEFESAGEFFPEIRVMTRSGDTPESERRAMTVHPPSILITTPESLNILLTSRRGQDLFADLKTVILDEIHAAADTKRGTHLMSAVERIAALFGEFQRIALSATVNPMERIARFVGGRRLSRVYGDVRFAPRSVSVVRPAMDKAYDLRVSYLLPLEETAVDDAPRTEGNAENPMWRAAASEIAQTVLKNRATLVFANSRRGVEKVARLINERAEEPLIYAHHGSLSREIREVVEGRLKAGALKAVAATNSLELGIDIGTVDEVVLLETPPSIASFMQRLGRAGHGVGEVSRGRLLALNPQDLINASVCAEALLDLTPEPIHPPSFPLDVLAQIILSMTAHGPSALDEVFDVVRTVDSYADLPRHLFDLVVEMLAGKYEGARLPALRPRLAVDRVDGTAEALPSAVRALYSSGGTIPDRGYYTVRLKDGGAKVGELDEEFVWERKLGDLITLGVQSWRIEAIGDSDVTVSPHRSRAAAPPFWTCEERGTSPFFAEKRAALLEQAENRLLDPDFRAQLIHRHRLEPAAAEALLRYLRLQKEAANGLVPHRHQVVVEHVSPASRHRMSFTVVHTEWGGKVNRPFAVALRSALSERYGTAVKVVHDDISVAVASEDYFSAETLFESIGVERAADLVKSNVRDTGFFGASFRENAARSLLILKAGFGKRTPLWLNRKRAKELRIALSSHEDFPVTLETYRACLSDDMDLAAFSARLTEVSKREIRVREVTTQRPSPFAESVLYKLSNELVYESDALQADRETALAPPLEAVLFSDTLRPRIPRAVVAALVSKLTRQHPGYSPRDGTELLEWVKERVLLKESEWLDLVSRTASEAAADREALTAFVARRAVALVRKTGTHYVVAIENLGKTACLRLDGQKAAVHLAMDGRPLDDKTLAAVKKAFKGSPHTAPLEDLLLDLLRFSGPIPLSGLAADLDLPPSEIEAALSVLVEAEAAVVDRITEDSETLEACHVEVLRSLLRMTRMQQSRSVPTQAATRLPLFLAARQKLLQGTEDKALSDVLEPLFGFAATAAEWEQEIFPARLPRYRTSDLDALLAGTNLRWIMQKDERVIFCLEEDTELFSLPVERGHRDEPLVAMFPDAASRRTVEEIARGLDLTSASDLEETLFDFAAEGKISANTFQAPRLGRKAYALRQKSLSRRSTSRWKRTETDASLWFLLRQKEPAMDALEADAQDRDRVRVLLDRYGVLFRELLEREISTLKWSALFRTLRIMELSGEVVGGRFFEGVSGLQFLAKDALHLLEARFDPPPVFYLNARDPASLCGLKIEGLSLPPRVAGCRLVYCGERLVLVSNRNAKNLVFYTEPDDPRLSEYLDVFAAALLRQEQPMAVIRIEKINEKSALRSPYRKAFESRFDTYADAKALQIQKRY